MLSFAFSMRVHAKCDQVSARQPCIAKQLRTSCLRTEIADPSPELKPSAMACKNVRTAAGLAPLLVPASKMYFAGTNATVIPCWTSAVLDVAFHTKTELPHEKRAYVLTARPGFLYAPTRLPDLQPVISAVPGGSWASAGLEIAMRLSESNGRRAIRCKRFMSGAAVSIARRESKLKDRPRWHQLFVSVCAAIRIPDRTA